jgi:hypothetical protein
LMTWMLNGNISWFSRHWINPTEVNAVSFFSDLRFQTRASKTNVSYKLGQGPLAQSQTCQTVLFKQYSNGEFLATKEKMPLLHRACTVY